MKKYGILFLTVSLIIMPSSLYAFSIDIDYEYDQGFFTTNPAACTDLERAVSVYESRINTVLSEINPGSSGNTWETSFYDPQSYGYLSKTDPVISASTIVLYVGAYDHRTDPSDSLAWSGPGTIIAPSYDPASAWSRLIYDRGQSHSLFSPWGGTISFSTDLPGGRSWFFDPDAPVPGNEYDFYTVAVHELGHVLGFGTSTQWYNLDAGNLFTGTNAVAANGGTPIPTDGSHWVDGTMSKVPVTGVDQEASLTPYEDPGVRKYFTDLDWASLQDLGWDVAAVPEPSAIALFFFGLSLFVFIRRPS